MPTKFEDAIAAAKTAHYEQPEVLQLIDLIVAQNERIKNLEFYSLEAKHRMTVTEKTVAEHDQSIASLAKSRDEHETRIAAIDHKPAADDKRLDELDKRVTTVEGAVGSKAFRKAEVKTNGTVAPVAETPKSHFWDAPKAPETPAAPQTA